MASCFDVTELGLSRTSVLLGLGVWTQRIAMPKALFAFHLAGCRPGSELSHMSQFSIINLLLASSLDSRG